MSYSNLAYFVLVPCLLFISCDTTSSNEEKPDLIEFITTEVDSIEADFIRFKTNFKLNKEYNDEDYKVSYELYISTEDEPSKSNSVSYNDVSDEEGLIEYDSQENEGTFINVVQGLELETEYYYRIVIIIGEYQKWSEISSFRTKEIVEIISTEVRNLKARSVSLYTVFTINGTWKYNSYVNYDIFISTDENPDESNSVEFFDSTDMEGLVHYDEEKEEGISSNPISDLLPSTKYYYRIKISFEDHEQLSDVVAFTTKEETYEETGGIEYYDKGEYSNGWRYLVAAPPSWNNGDEDPRASWGCYNQSVDTKSNIGDGFENTKKIIESGCGNDSEDLIAAELADQLELNGFDDWFLPSMSELVKLIRFKDADLDGSAYWTSTDEDYTSSYEASVVDKWGYEDRVSKSSKYYVRPIRRY